MKTILILIFALVLFIGCKTQDPIIKTEYVYVNKNTVDSLYVYEKDSIFIKEKNDTILINKFKILYKDKIKLVRDSIYVNKTDTIVRTVKETKTKIVYKYDAVWWIGIASIIYFIIKLILFFRLKI